MTDTYVLDDRCWIKLHGVEHPVEGRVVGIMNMPQHTAVFYVVQVIEGSHCYLEVRDALLMSRFPDKMIPRISYTYQGVTSLQQPSELN